jgi:hypothetical protein
MEYSEDYVISLIKEHFKERGYLLLKPRVVRGRLPDIIAVKDSIIVLVEAKGSKGDVLKGLAQAMHYGQCVDFAYLAIPDDICKRSTSIACRNLGIGLLTVGKGGIRIRIKPKHREALQSVKSLLFKDKKPVLERPEKSDGEPTGLIRLMGTRLSLKLLCLFCSEPKSVYSVSEIARKLNCSVASASIGVAELVNEGVVSFMWRGNLKLCQMNYKYPLSDALIRFFGIKQTTGRKSD